MTFTPISYVVPPAERHISALLPQSWADPTRSLPACPGVRPLLLAAARIADAARRCGAGDPELAARRLLGRHPDVDPQRLADRATAIASSVLIDGWARDPWRATWALLERSLTAST